MTDAQDRAEKLAAEKYPMPDKPTTFAQARLGSKQEGFTAGYLARDAEPVTVSLNQAWKSADAYYKRETGLTSNDLALQDLWVREHWYRRATGVLRAAGIRIEGDE